MDKKELAEKTESENCTIILFPEFVTLKTEVEKLRKAEQRKKRTEGADND